MKPDTPITMPLPDIIEPELWNPGDPHRYNVLNDHKDHWEALNEMIERHDENMCKAWKDELDKLLISAGLFSAAMTAFAVESFKWLQDPRDANTTLLAHISLQLGNDSLTTEIVSGVMNPYSPTPSAIRINVFWFLSLTLSLSTVLIGILCLQWLREFQRDVESSYKDALALRQIRYRGLIAWKVPEIVSALPLTLQIALVLFFAGVFDLLLQRHRFVAFIILVPILFSVSFLLFTTIAPTLQRFYLAGIQSVKGNPFTGSQCPYKSPQAWIFMHVVSFPLFLLRFVSCSVDPKESKLDDLSAEDWADIDKQWRNIHDKNGDQDLIFCFEWMRRHLCQGFHGFCYLYHCFSSLGLVDQRAIITRSGDSTPDLNTLEAIRKARCEPEYTALRFLLMGEDPTSPRITFLSTTIVERWVRLALSTDKSHLKMDEICRLPQLDEWLLNWDAEVQGIFTIQLLIQSINWTRYIGSFSEADKEIGAESLIESYLEQVERTLCLPPDAWSMSSNTLAWTLIRLKNWLKEHPAVDPGQATYPFIKIVNGLHHLYKEAKTRKREQDKYLGILLAHAAWAGLKNVPIHRIDGKLRNWLEVDASGQRPPEKKLAFWPSLPEMSKRQFLPFPEAKPPLYSRRNTRTNTRSDTRNSVHAPPTQISYAAEETVEPESGLIHPPQQRPKPVPFPPAIPPARHSFPIGTQKVPDRREPMYIRARDGSFRSLEGPAPELDDHIFSQQGVAASPYAPRQLEHSTNLRGPINGFPAAPRPLRSMHLPSSPRNLETAPTPSPRPSPDMRAMTMGSNLASMSADVDVDVLDDITGALGTSARSRKPTSGLPDRGL